MAIRRSRSRSELQRIKRRSALRRRAETQRNMRLENLEGRRLLAVGPQLVSIQPNEGSFLEDGDTRNTAFEDFSFLLTQPPNTACASWPAALQTVALTFP